MRLRIAALIFALVAGGAATYWYYALRQVPPSDQIRVSGNIETTEAQVSFKIGGRVIERKFDEGEMVKQGEVVALLDTADLQCNVDLRQAELKVAEAALAELLAGSRPEEIASAKAAMEKAEHALQDLEAGSRPQEIEAAKAAVGAAAADVARSQADYTRATSNFQRKTISAEEYRCGPGQLRCGRGKAPPIRRATIAGDRRLAQGADPAGPLGLGPGPGPVRSGEGGTAQEDIDQGRARAQQARAALELAKTQLSYATVVAPLSGVVLSKNIEPGEYVAPGTPVVTVGDLVNVWLRGYIEENQLGQVKLDRRAWVTTDSYPGKKYEGRVGFIASEAEFTPKNVQTQKERVKLVYRIKIDITNPNMELKPGMPADAIIEVAPGK